MEITTILPDLRDDQLTQASPPISLYTNTLVLCSMYSSVLHTILTGEICVIRNQVKFSSLEPLFFHNAVCLITCAS